MNTYLYDLIDSIDERWSEVQVLIDKTSEEEHLNQPLYNALCRATILLIVAHFEAFIKDVVKAIISDINKFSNFAKSPSSLKRTFCKAYFDNSQIDSKDGQQRVKRLISLLDTLDTKFVVDPFLVEGTFGNNKNPSPTIINKVCKNFGVRDFFSLISNSKLDVVFKDESSEVAVLLADLRKHLLETTQNHPYNMSISLFSIVESSSTNKGDPLIWGTFIDQLLKQRNDIAHGSSVTNSLSIGELVDYKNKVLILEYALILIIGYKSCSMD